MSSYDLPWIDSTLQYLPIDMSIEYMMIIKADNGFTMRKGQTRREVLHGMYEILSGNISGYSTNLLAKGQAMPHLPNNMYLYRHISYFPKEKVAGLFFMKVGILFPEPSPGLSYSVMPIARTKYFFQNVL